MYEWIVFMASGVQHRVRCNTVDEVYERYPSPNGIKMILSVPEGVLAILGNKVVA